MLFKAETVGWQALIQDPGLNVWTLLLQTKNTLVDNFKVNHALAASKTPQWETHKMSKDQEENVCGEY